ncbi:hypothetical protein BKA70DRAFT_1480002 [Coprinopsis sp. MPI-PUGE-AT-0042]|nr:hypothetical protein BKA70DRAFT_1480002 [Coprinopsis sp. MPI-PUGE-AT-0042]
MVSAQLSGTSGSESTIDSVNLTANANDQSASLLFAVFPPEIRAEIFCLALCSFPDISSPYRCDSHWYRPGYTAPRLTGVSLLLACKRIYGEARNLTWTEGNGNDEETFWWGSPERRPYEYGGPIPLNSFYATNDWGDDWDSSDDGSTDESNEELGSDEFEDDDDYKTIESNGDARERHIKDFLRRSLADMEEAESESPRQSRRQRKFTPSHWSKIHGIHIFPQMYAFSRHAFIQTFIQAKGLRPTTVKATIRYTDWWNRRWNARLDLASIVPELDEYYFPESVDRFIIEAEFAEHKKSQLDDMNWRWKRLDEMYLEFDEDAGVKEWEWTGTATYDEEGFAQGDTMTYIVKVLTFSAKPSEAEWDGTPFDRALAIKDYEAILESC